MNNVILGGGRCRVRGHGQHVHNSHFLLDSQCHEAKDCVVTNSSPHKAQGSGTEQATNELLKEGADGRQEWRDMCGQMERWRKRSFSAHREVAFKSLLLNTFVLKPNGDLKTACRCYLGLARVMHLTLMHTFASPLTSTCTREEILY